MKKILAATLIGATLFTTSGCYGQFSLTKKVNKFHESLGDKWIRTIALWFGGEVVYGFTFFVDIFVLNVVEFWTGSNPVASNTLEQTDEQGNKLIATKLPGGALEVTTVKIDGSVHTVTLVKNQELVTAYDSQGKVLSQFSGQAN